MEKFSPRHSGKKAAGQHIPKAEKRIDFPIFAHLSNYFHNSA